MEQLLLAIEAPAAGFKLDATPLREPIEILFERAVEIVATVLETEPTVIAYSGGKDSSACLVIALNALKRVIARGGTPYPLLVGHTDTGTENPALAVANHEALAQLSSWAEKEGLDVRVKINRPALHAGFAVKVLSGSSLVTWPGSRRQCSVAWKVEPNRQMMRRYLPELKLELTDRAGRGDGAAATLLGRLEPATPPVVVLGSRLDESDRRQASMERHDQHADRITTERDEDGKIIGRTLSPISDWTEDDVWELLYLSSQVPDWKVWRENHNEILDLYRGAAGGSCVVSGSGRLGRTACGSRFGCHTCAAVDTDHSLDAMIDDPRWHFMSDLHVLRDRLSALRFRWDRRNWIAREIDPTTKHVRIEPDTFSPDELEYLVRAYLTADRKERRRADRFKRSMEMNRDPDDAYIRHCRSTGEAPDPDYQRRMTQTQFQMFGARELIALDFYSALLGRYDRPFHILALYDEVNLQGIETRPEKLESAPASKVPSAKWYPLPDAHSEMFHPLSDAAALLGVFDTDGPEAKDSMARTPDGWPIWWINKGVEFDVDEEAAQLVLELEWPNYLKAKHDSGPSDPLETVRYYLRLGVVTVSPAGLAAVSKMSRRTQAIRTAKLDRLSPDDLYRLSIDDLSHRNMGGRAHKRPDLPTPVEPIEPMLLL